MPFLKFDKAIPVFGAVFRSHSNSKLEGVNIRAYLSGSLGGLCSLYPARDEGGAGQLRRDDPLSGSWVDGGHLLGIPG